MATTDLGTYQVGETLSVRRQTKDADGALAAPTTLRFEVEERGKDTVTNTLGTDSEVETIAMGDYQLNHVTTAPGLCDVRITMTVSGKTVIASTRRRG